MTTDKFRRCGGSGLSFGAKGGSSIHHKSVCEGCGGSGLDELGGKHWTEFVLTKPAKTKGPLLTEPSPTPPQGEMKDPKHVLHLRWWFRQVHGDQAWAALNALEKKNKQRYLDALSRIQHGLAEEVAARLIKGTGPKL